MARNISMILFLMLLLPLSNACTKKLEKKPEVIINEWRDKQYFDTNYNYSVTNCDGQLSSAGVVIGFDGCSKNGDALAITIPLNSSGEIETALKRNGLDLTNSSVSQFLIWIAGEYSKGRGLQYGHDRGDGQKWTESVAVLASSVAFAKAIKNGEMKDIDQLTLAYVLSHKK